MKKSNTAEVVEQIELSQLHPFPDHPFEVRDDDNMQQTVESIREYGVLVGAAVLLRQVSTVPVLCPMFSITAVLVGM